MPDLGQQISACRDFKSAYPFSFGILAKPCPAISSPTIQCQTTLVLCRTLNRYIFERSSNIRQEL